MSKGAQHKKRKKIMKTTIIFLAKTKNDRKNEASTTYSVEVPEGLSPTKFARIFFKNYRRDVVMPERVERLVSWGCVSVNEKNQTRKIKL